MVGAEVVGAEVVEAAVTGAETEAGGEKGEPDTDQGADAIADAEMIVAETAISALGATNRPGAPVTAT